jgi:hypothetical protein
LIDQGSGRKLPAFFVRNRAVRCPALASQPLPECLVNGLATIAAVATCWASRAQTGPPAILMTRKPRSPDPPIAFNLTGNVTFCVHSGSVQIDTRSDASTARGVLRLNKIALKSLHKVATNGALNSQIPRFGPISDGVWTQSN